MISQRQLDANRRNAAKSHGPIQFRAAFEAEHQPVGPTEQVLVEDMVVSRWRLNRIRKMEPGFFALRLEFLKGRIKDDFTALDGQAHLALVVRDDAQDSDTLGKMSRYEGRFERTFYKALKELQRLQALRATVSDSGNGTVSQNRISPASPRGADGLAVCPEPVQPPPPPATPQPPVAPEMTGPEAIGSHRVSSLFYKLIC
jgi:hypothetical protein